jgi:hypothetical protein
MNVVEHAAPPDRVRANTSPVINERLDQEARGRLHRSAAQGSSDELTERIFQLEQEWDFDRVLEAEASLMGIVGLMLAISVDKRLLVLPAFVSTMMVLHANHGWYPLLPLFRRLGIRSRSEIERERYGLKALRGDFDHVPPPDISAAARAAAAWKAVCA